MSEKDNARDCAAAIWAGMRSAIGNPLEAQLPVHTREQRVVRCPVILEVRYSTTGVVIVSSINSKARILGCVNIALPPLL